MPAGAPRIKKKKNQCCSLRTTFSQLGKVKRRRAAEEKTDWGMWSLAIPHSTGGELYHNPPLQTKHTAPNKDGTVRRAEEERCHRQHNQLWSALLCALYYTRGKKIKSDRKVAAKRMDAKFSLTTLYVSACVTLKSSRLDPGGPHQPEK